MDFVQIEVFGILLVRPNNMISNMFVLITGVILFLLIRKENKTNDRYLTYFSYFFLLIGVGGGISGISHALNYDFPEIMHNPGHKVAWTIVGLGLLGGELASIMLLRPESLQRILRIVVWLKLAVYLFFLYHSEFYKHTEMYEGLNHFNLVRYNIAPSVLGIILPSHLFAYFKDKRQGSGLVLIGILSLISTIVIYATKFSLHPWYDFNDISHSIQIGCMILMYLGVIKGYRSQMGQPAASV